MHQTFLVSNVGVLLCRVHTDEGSKLDPRAREGRWLGFDTESHAHRVYYSSSCSVAVERNVYFGAAPQLEGESLVIPSTEHEQRSVQPAPKILPSTPALHTPSTVLPPAWPPPPTLPPVQTTAL